LRISWCHIAVGKFAGELADNVAGADPTRIVGDGNVDGDADDAATVEFREFLWNAADEASDPFAFMRPRRPGRFASRHTKRFVSRNMSHTRGRTHERRGNWRISALLRMMLMAEGDDRKSNVL
jgi:hypothetical protein